MITQRSIILFKKTAQQIPAYKAFLLSHDCKPSSVNSPGTFTKYVPLTDKEHYLVPNELKDLIWEPDLSGLLLLCATSGSTGEPYYFPRNERLSWQYSQILERYLTCSSYGRGRTLVIIGFGMGVWIGGVITLRAFEIAAQRIREPVAILPTGYNKLEIVKALKRVAPRFDQTIIVGYPPFVKELVDESVSEGINLSALHTRFLFAAEAFTERFRDYICEAAGLQNPLRDTLNIYGSADIGAMAYESPLSILMRRLIMQGDPQLRRTIFHQIEKTPTLAQYDPTFIEFEEVDEDLVLTGDGALPLIRYSIGDHGGVFDYADAELLFRQYNIDLKAEINKANITELVNVQHPFVYVYERKNLAATLHGIIIYPEFIKEALMHNDIHAYFTGRFTMSTKHDVRHNQFLQVNIELRKDYKPSHILEELALETVHKSLIRKSSEFTEVSRSRKTDKLIEIVLWLNGHPRYFKQGTKQKWVEKA